MTKNSKISTREGESYTFKCYCGFTIIGATNQTFALRKKLHGKKCGLKEKADALPHRFIQHITRDK